MLSVIYFMSRVFCGISVEKTFVASLCVISGCRLEKFVWMPMMECENLSFKAGVFILDGK